MYVGMSTPSLPSLPAPLGPTLTVKVTALALCVSSTRVSLSKYTLADRYSRLIALVPYQPSCAHT